MNTILFCKTFTQNVNKPGKNKYFQKTVLLVFYIKANVLQETSKTKQLKKAHLANKFDIAGSQPSLIKVYTKCKEKYIYARSM